MFPYALNTTARIYRRFDAVIALFFFLSLSPVILRFGEPDDWMMNENLAKQPSRSCSWEGSEMLLDTERQYYYSEKTVAYWGTETLVC